MEMHQVRYFLAVARTLNFTRAAEECHVAQPSLTRAVRQLEGELGGDLFRRERPHAQLTELGQRMLPLLQQCYDSALAARSVASAIKGGKAGALRLAISCSIDASLLVPHLIELSRRFHGLELKFMRGTPAEIAELLKKGEAELGIAAHLGEAWERLDSWPLFTEDFDLVVSVKHSLAERSEITIEDLRPERLVLRTYCEHGEEFREVLRGFDFDLGHTHEIGAETDLLALIEANIGVGLVPRSSASPATLSRGPVSGLNLRRTVYLYGVAGRQRTPVASALMKMLRACDWSRYAVSSDVPIHAQR
jgi:DNA-binding transcriptional LysR family regulator